MFFSTLSLEHHRFLTKNVSEAVIAGSYSLQTHGGYPAFKSISNLLLLEISPLASFEVDLFVPCCRFLGNQSHVQDCTEKKVTLPELHASVGDTANIENISDKVLAKDNGNEIRINLTDQTTEIKDHD